MDTLAVFRSRSDALKIYRLLIAKRIACAAVNTPSYLNTGCGLSVVFPKMYIAEAREMIAYSGVKSFVGFYPKK